MKKIAYLLTISLIAGSLFTGCGNGSSSDDTAATPAPSATATPTPTATPETNTTVPETACPGFLPC